MRSYGPKDYHLPVPIGLGPRTHPKQGDPVVRFTKMHGCGNDYVYIDAFAESTPADIPALARAVSDRHTGVGGDGLILIEPSQRADARMRMWNADGSRGEMCGNGVRCVAKYVYDHGIARKDALTIETDKGVLTLRVRVRDGQVTGVRVNMGPPILRAGDIPTTLAGDPPVDVPLECDGRTLRVTCVSMGNPHCVMFVDRLTDDWVKGVGPRLERHAVFPQRVNVEFVQVISPAELSMRVWERGSGETQACGSGACAALVAGVLTGRTGREVLVHLPGGDLTLAWSEADDVLMTGPAVEVFRGQWPEESAIGEICRSA